MEDEQPDSRVWLLWDRVVNVPERTTRDRDPREPREDSDSLLEDIRVFRIRPSGDPEEDFRTQYAAVVMPMKRQAVDYCLSRLKHGLERRCSSAAGE